MLSKEDFFSIKCDIVIPAALELQIDEEIASKMNCQYIVEGANGPIFASAENVLSSKNITVIPDVLANSGGVLVSYYEWLQNRYGEYWEENTVKEKMDHQMKKTYQKMVNTSQEYKCSLREACYIYALKKIDEVYKTKGM